MPWNSRDGKVAQDKEKDKMANHSSVTLWKTNEPFFFQGRIERKRVEGENPVCLFKESLGRRCRQESERENDFEKHRKVERDSVWEPDGQIEK